MQSVTGLRFYAVSGRPFSVWSEARDPRGTIVEYTSRAGAST